MRHLSGYKRLGRPANQRRAMLRNLASSLVLHERIDTSLVKAKELRRIVERMVTLGKRGDLHARRQAASYLFDNDATSKLFGDLASRFQSRPGGYTRILRRGVRFGDGSKLATIEFVDFDFSKKAESGDASK
jgi:large subunit ribosomal protein L17